eukprot:TRINITY_DN108666_c0_g1_i1.p1 TRINITY_DN108666_c0_g1~~TRINITY_DN108666_c0_g1_i1.p1  ORF type:complete len:346 (+),score=48.19 TRINITY_DN108666_c0_g1_i1:55-1038(+)
MPQPQPFVQFRVSNVSPETDADELLEALEGQLALRDIQLDRMSLRLSQDRRTKEAVFLLPRDEATLLLGPMQKAKASFGDRLVQLHFERTSRRQRSDATSSKSRPGEELVERLPQPRLAAHHSFGESTSAGSSSRVRSDLDGRGPLEITGLATPSFVLDGHQEPGLADGIPMAVPCEPSRLPDSSKPSPSKSLMDRNLTSEETLALLKDLALKRRCKSKYFSPEDLPTPYQRPPPEETHAEPLHMAYTPAPTLPALPEMHSMHSDRGPLEEKGEKGSRGILRGPTTTPAVQAWMPSQPPEDLPPEVATEGSVAPKHERTCFLGLLLS